MFIWQDLVIKLMNSEDSYQGHKTSIFGKCLYDGD